MNRLKQILFIISIINLIFMLRIKAQPIPDSLYTSNDEKFKVDSIKIVGNDITEGFIILRELTFKEGDIVTSSQLNYDRERVFSLRLFSKVDVYPVTRDTLTTVYIDVSETWYIYPIPFIRRADKSNSTYSYGMNFTYKNFRGRNENISTTVSLGYDPFFSVYYDNPAFFYSNNLGFSFGFSYLNYQNKSTIARMLYGKDFKSKFYSSFLSLYKRLDQFNVIAVSSSFDYINFPTDNNFKGLSASGKSIDRTISLGVGYSFDSRDLKQFPQKGIYFGSLIIHKGFGINNINYNLVGFEYMQYEKPVGELITRWRLAYRSSFGSVVPYYDYSYLGYDEYVRGHSFEKVEGHNSIVSSFEISYPVLKEFDFSIKIPLLPRKLTSARIGIYVTAFADAGQAFNNHYNIELKNFFTGYGVGLTILALPYNALRFEYAVNGQGKGEYLIGTGFAF